MYLHPRFNDISLLLLPYKHQRPWSNQVRLKTGKKAGGRGGNASKFSASEAFYKIKATHFVFFTNLFKLIAHIGRSQLKPPLVNHWNVWASAVYTSAFIKVTKEKTWKKKTPSLFLPSVWKLDQTKSPEHISPFCKVSPASWNFIKYWLTDVLFSPVKWNPHDFQQQSWLLCKLITLAISKAYSTYKRTLQ